VPPSSAGAGCGHSVALDLKHWWVAWSQQPFESALPQAAAQSLSAEHFTVVHSGGGGGGGGGFSALPVPFGAGSVAGASWVVGVPSGGGSDDAHAAISVPTVRRAAA
jgi:hypothetical protein